MDVDVEAREESIAKGFLILHIHGEIPVPTVVVEPYLKVLGHIAAAPSTDFGSLSFRWTMEDLVYTKREDGYYYDVEEVQYHRLEEDGQYCMKRWPRFSRELQTTIMCPLLHWMPWFPRQSTM